MTYSEIVEALEKAQVENAEWDAALLLESFCKVTKNDLVQNPKKDYASKELEKAVKARISHTPLQYILGEWDFYRQKFEVNEHCLIPRSDTEILVEQAIRLLPQKAYFADLCTGSGCIAVSILAERPDTHAFAVDLFPKTAELAKRNAKKNGVDNRLTVEVKDVLATDFSIPGERPVLICCNPPYIRSDVVDSLSEEVKKEPHAALDGGKDGLLFYRTLIPKIPNLLAKDGFALFEIGFDQGDAVKNLCLQAGLAEVSVIRDYGGNDRVLFCKNQLEKE